MTYTRRTCLQLAAATAWGRTPGAALHAYVGCYTTAQRKARGDGIHVYRIDPATGQWTPLQTLAKLVNPSFLASSPNGRFLYSAHGDEKYATAFAIDPQTHFLTPLNQASTGGVNGAHLAIHPDARFAVVANYGSATISVLPIKPDGTLADHTQLLELPGTLGPHRIEQAAAHPHQIVFDPSGRYVAVPDKGLDRVFLFHFDPDSGKLTPTAQRSLAMRSGAGPRHLAFHPTLPIAWVLNELNSSVTTCRWDAAQGQLTPAQVLPTLPPDFTGDSTAAEIVTTRNGRFVYCSNRGHDSIAMYIADARTGLLTSTDWIASGGKIPRFLSLDPHGRTLYAANEQSDTITAFRINTHTGRLTPTGVSTRNLSPVTIAFAVSGGAILPGSGLPTQPRNRV